MPHSGDIAVSDYQECVGYGIIQVCLSKELKVKFVFDNVGPVKSATIELGKLTVVCGKNNTGKTYLTNCLYEFYRLVARKCDVKVREEVPPLATSMLVDLEKYRYAVVNAIQDRARQFRETSTILQGGQVHVQLDPMELRLDTPVSQTTWGSRIMNWRFGVKKDGTILEIVRRETKDDDLERNAELRKKQWYAGLNRIINGYLFRQDLNGGFIGDACSLTSERMGIAYFKDCIDIALRARSQDGDSSIEDADVSLHGESTREFPLFPNNVYAMLDMISYVSQRKKLGLVERMKFLDGIIGDLEHLTDGVYDIKDGKIVFSPSGSEGLVLDVQEASSSVRALFALDMYVRYFAEKGDLLVIDEPEMNLHPAKQRQLARFLAKLVNSGIRVFMTTHSDYMVREFNTLIALSGEGSFLRKIQENERYLNEELLSPNSVCAYVSKDVGGNKFEFEKVPVSGTRGIDIKSIDSVIDDMNRIQDLIVWGE